MGEPRYGDGEFYVNSISFTRSIYNRGNFAVEI